MSLAYYFAGAIACISALLGVFQLQRESYSVPLGNVARQAGFALADVPDLTGKVALVTGANTGVGYVTARELATRGCHVILACRSVKRGEAAATRMRTAGVDGRLLAVTPLDLSSLASVRQCAATVSTEHERLDILVLNAGLNAGVFTTSADGVELSFAVNHLGHFLLTKLLMPLLPRRNGNGKESSSNIDVGRGRVVVLSSDSHFQTYEPEGVLLPSPASLDAARASGTASDRQRVVRELERTHGQRFDGMLAYGQSKLCNVLFAAELARRSNSSGSSGSDGPAVYINTAHPGLTHSEFYTRIAKAMEEGGQPWTARVVRLFDDFVAPYLAYSPETAALTPLYLAAGTDVESKQLSGKYFVPIATELPVSKHGQNMTLQHRLWQTSELLVGEEWEEGVMGGNE